MFDLLAQTTQPVGAAQQPAWMIWAAFILSILNLGLIAGPIWVWLFKDGKLDFRLTLEVFFRLIDSGESLFANASLVSEGAAVKVTGVELTLTRMGAPKKTYPVRVLAYGLKAPSSSSEAKHLFYTRSPYHYMPQDNVLRPLWHCILDSYCEGVKEQFTQFNDFLMGLLEEVRTRQVANQEMTEDEKVAFFKRVDSEIRDRVVAIMDKVQLEGGRYELSATVSYQARAGKLRRKTGKAVMSSITFEIEQNVRDVMKARLRDTLHDIASNKLLGKDNAIRFAEVVPSNVREEELSRDVE